jgi:hypothetical protein
MKCGTILSDTQFEFSDGTKGEKLLVVLNDGETNDYIVVKTTSVSDYKKTEFGCQIDGRYPNFFLPKGCCCLRTHTWVQLDQFFEFNSTHFLTANFSGRINRIGLLPDEIIIELLHCAIDSQDITQIQQNVLIEMVEGLQGPR